MHAMIGSTARLNKILLGALISLILWYLYMDILLYIRVQNYPIDRGSIYDNITAVYIDSSWIGCGTSPLCDITVKALLLDHTNHYLLSPLAVIIDNIFRIRDISLISPNAISIFHVLVAIISAKCVSSDSLPFRRIGVLLFQVRTFLDDMDGHIARARRNIRGERSEVGSFGYYVDGICDGLGCIALLIGIFIFLRNNPPRRGYMHLPTLATVNHNEHEASLAYKYKVTSLKTARTIGCFALQLLISSTAWNRYIALYQDILESNDVSLDIYNRQTLVFRSTFFFAIAFLWRLVNIHNMLDCLLLALFCDKLWEFLKFFQYLGFGILLTAICVTEIHLLDVKNFVYGKLTNIRVSY